MPPDAPPSGTHSSRIRVLHVIPRLAPTGGAETSLAQLLRPLADHGVDSTIVALLPHPDTSRLDEIRSSGTDVRVLGNRSPFAQVLQLRRIIREIRPDLVHTTLLEAGLAGRIAARLTGTPAVHSVVNTVYHRGALTAYGAAWKVRLYQLLELCLTRFATTGLHALTETAAENARQHLGARTGTITVIPRGRDVRALGQDSEARRRTVRKLLNLPGDVPVLLNVARQDRQKGHVHLIRAFALIRSEIPEAVLIIAGRQGAATPDIEATIRTTAVGNGVMLLGARGDIGDLLCAADIFVFSSLWEGLGGAVLEAMALQRPVVTFAVPAVCEIVGDTALKVPIGDDSALAAAVASLVQDRETGAELAERAHQRFERLFTVDIVARRTATWYRDVVETNRPARRTSNPPA